VNDPDWEWLDESPKISSSIFFSTKIYNSALSASFSLGITSNASPTIP
jgi:hypothetical protein